MGTPRTRGRLRRFSAVLADAFEVLDLAGTASSDADVGGFFSCKKTGRGAFGTTGNMKESGSRKENHEGVEYSIAAKGLLKKVEQVSKVIVCQTKHVKKPRTNEGQKNEEPVILARSYSNMSTKRAADERLRVASRVT
jgi:hypothetical protein